LSPEYEREFEKIKTKLTVRKQAKRIKQLERENAELIGTVKRFNRTATYYHNVMNRFRNSKYNSEWPRERFIEVLEHLGELIR
jgi:predicted RNase H-like nuclease (RuvC/YqgF family)